MDAAHCPALSALSAFMALTVARWFAIVRLWSPWIAPRQGRSTFALDKEAVMCSFLSPQGRHLVLLAVSGIDNITSLFRSSDSGRVVLQVRAASLEFRDVKTC